MRKAGVAGAALICSLVAITAAVVMIWLNIRAELDGYAKGNNVSDEAIANGHEEPMEVSETHFVTKNPLKGSFEGMGKAVFGMGCFWGAEKKFWQLPGVYTTAVGYAGGATPNPNYREVCSGRTGHAEVVLVVYDPSQVSYETLLKVFWESHDPTQGDRQGNDTGSQYRSALYWYSQDQMTAALASRDAFQTALTAAGYRSITTEFRQAPEFFYAEDDHQQYLAKNPRGYCGLGGTGVSCPVGVAK